MRLLASIVADGTLVFACLALAAASGARPADGEVTSDQPAALLVYPYVTVDSAQGADTLLQLSNTSTTPIVVRCFYEGGAINPLTGIVDPKIAESLFQLTPRQPIAWRASQGLATFPLDGVDRIGPGGAFNENSQIPPVPEDPFVGILRCIAVDRSFLPTERNDLIGTATLAQRSEDGSFTDATQYNAIGIPARIGAGNGDNTLGLGGNENEYDACPLISLIPHAFESALDPVARTSSVSTTLILVPCSDDLAHQLPAAADVKYDVTNEFEQHLGTSQHMQFQQVSTLSAIGGSSLDRSIFSARVTGTLTGQTRIQAVAGSGVLALAIETQQDLSDPSRTRRAAFNAHRLGFRDEPDTLVMGPAELPTMSPTRGRTATATAQRPSPTATATAAPTHTATPTSTPRVTPPVPSPTLAPHNGGGCSITMARRRDAAALVPLLGFALLLVRKRLCHKE